MYDICFFSCDLLVTLMSSQLFVGTPSVVNVIAEDLSLPNPDIYVGPFSQNQFFLNYLFNLIETVDTTAQFVPKRFFQALLAHIMNEMEPPAGSIVAGLVTSYKHHVALVASFSQRLKAAVRSLEAPIGAAGSSPEESRNWAINEFFSAVGKNDYDGFHLCELSI